MSMKLELETNNLSKQDVEMLRLLDNETLGKLEKLQSRIEFLMNQLREKDQEATHLRLELSQKPNIRDHGSMQELVLDLLMSKDEALTIEEIGKKLQTDKLHAIRSALYVLRHAKKVDGSNGRPKRYFIKERGNPELREALPKGTKISYGLGTK